MRRVFFIAKLPRRLNAPLAALQRQWSADAALRVSDPKWQEHVWRGNYRTFLKRIQDNRCLFCEAHLTGNSGAVEHYWPKTVYYKHKFRWKNWSYACKACNSAKGTIDTRANPWLDPRFSNPATQLGVLPSGALLPKGGPGKNHNEAKRAIDGADLNCVRTKREKTLVKDRQAICEEVRIAINVFNGAQTSGNQNLIKAARMALLRKCTEPNLHMCGVALCYLHQQAKLGNVSIMLYYRAVMMFRSNAKKKADEVFV